jgi:hypothetical protein
MKWSGSWSGRAGIAGAPWPLAELVISDIGIQVRPTYRIMQPLFALICQSRMPDARLGWDQVELAEFCRALTFTAEPPGIRLWVRGKEKPVVFRPGFLRSGGATVATILDVLEANHVPVDRSVHVSPLLGL